MPRPDMKGSSVIDRGGAAAEDDAKGGADGTEIETPGEDPNAFDEPGRAADGDRGAADPNDGEGAGAQEEPVEGADEGAEPGSDDPGVNGAHDVDKLRDSITKSVMEQLQKDGWRPPSAAGADEAKPAELSEEDWTKQEAEWGSSRATIKKTMTLAAHVARTLRDEFNGRFAKFEKSDALRGLAREKGYTDALRYPKDVDEFLSHYDARHHSNPDLLMRAVVYARGKNVTANIQRVRHETERNRKIAGPGRPAGASPARRAGPAGGRALTPIEKSAARAMGWSDAEYDRQKGTGARIA